MNVKNSCLETEFNTSKLSFNMPTEVNKKYSHPSSCWNADVLYQQDEICLVFIAHIFSMVCVGRSSAGASILQNGTLPGPSCLAEPSAGV
jgi:hypothetical protein